MNLQEKFELESSQGPSIWYKNKTNSCMVRKCASC